MTTFPTRNYQQQLKTERERALNDLDYALHEQKYYTQQKLYIQLIDFLYRIGYYEDNESYFIKKR